MFTKASAIEWAGWSSLQEDLVRFGTDPDITVEEHVESARIAVAAYVRRFMHIVGEQLDIPCVSDIEAKRRYANLGYILGVGHLHGENDCLADSLLQCLGVEGVLPMRLVGRGGVGERAEACRACRQHLANHAEPRVRPATRNAFLEEYLHGPYIVKFFLVLYENEALSKPREIIVVTHSRFDACVQEPGSRSTICAATTPVYLPFGPHSDDTVVSLHTFNESGRGLQGIHFSPVIQRPCS